ncbi:MAG: hypothetical protein H0V18_07825 [Pyrinomonadaceae bacterium]|nr:hypothetical protein [Pyrinomonadaceae bacterium]
MIQSLAVSLEKREYRFLNIPVATAELVAYESRVSPHTGRISYSAPEGMNDDTVIARALMLKSVLDRGLHELDEGLAFEIDEYRGR